MQRVCFCKANLYIATDLAVQMVVNEQKKRYQTFSFIACGCQSTNCWKTWLPNSTNYTYMFEMQKMLITNIATKKVGGVPFHVVDPLDVTIKMPCISHHHVTTVNVMWVDSLKNAPTQHGKRKVCSSTIDCISSY